MSVLSAATAKRVEDLLLQRKLVTEEELNKAKDKSTQTSNSLFSVLLGDGVVTNEELVKAIAKVNDIPYVNLLDARVKPEILELLPKETARAFMAVPLGQMQNRLVVAMLDADNVQAVDFLSSKIGKPLKVYMASEEGISHVIMQYAENVRKEVGQMLEGAAIIQAEKDAQVTDVQKKNIKTIVQDSPISKALSVIMEYAANSRASDVHIEPMERDLRIRCRIDGVMRELMRLPKSNEASLISRVKILSSLKIDEHRIPQDGQFTLRTGNKTIDLRIAISPVVWGEQIVIRLLDKTSTSLKLQDLGYTGRPLRMLRESIKRPNGMILNSGPTGSGKSTSLYALLQEIKDDSINIITLEDPVEYKMDGINQIQVNTEVGLTFASGLRAILRQDPNVIMVGEIRDKEAAALGIQAALTGHLVLSTLHTNSASGILPRLLDMGIEPFLIASTVNTVIGQRLVRRLSEARQTYQSTPAETASINQTIGAFLPKSAGEVQKVGEDLGYSNLPVLNQNAYTLFKAEDTPETPGGYKGRMGIYEVFKVTEEIQNLIMERSTTSHIQQTAQKQGMLTMRQDGYLKALAGFTTLAEIDRVTAADAE